MKKLISFFTMVFFLCISLSSIAQVTTYTFSQPGGSYIEIIGDTTVAIATGTSGAAGLDDISYAINTIPFPFEFNGGTYYDVGITTNGFIGFGTAPGGAIYTPISTLTSTGVAAPLARDLIGTFGFRCNRTISSNTLTGVSNFAGIVAGRVISGTGIPVGTTIVSFDVGLKTVTMSANATSSSTAGAVNATIQVAAGSIVRGTTGAIGSRIHTIQWKNFRRFTTTDTLENFNFQVRLYETSNVLEFVYGAFAKSPVTPTITQQVGLRGTAITDFNNRTTTTDWSATTAGGTNGASCTITPLILPPNGLTFRWAPLVVVADDMGITAASIGSPGKIISVGKGYDIIATAKNFGTTTQNIVPVYYTVNGGSPVGPVNTVGPIVQNATENVTFSGGNAFIPLVSGVSVLKIYTDLAGEGNPSNDTLTVNVNVQDKISAFPYSQNFTTPTGWTILTQVAAGSVAPWGLGLCTNPEGTAGDVAAVSDCFGGTNSSGRSAVLRSPEMDLTLLTNPVLDFYVAYRTFTDNSQDSLEIVISTNGGTSFFSAATVYKKSDSTLPSLATMVPSGSAYVPSAQGQWRHETIDLSNVAGASNVVIGFRSISDYGNNIWIDNVVVSNVNSLCVNNVTGIGSYTCNPLVTVNFLSLPRPYQGNVVTSGTKNEKSKDSYSSVFTEYTGNVIINSGTPSDNPGGGDLFISQYTNNDPGQTITANSGQTTGDGSIFTPTSVYHDYWFTVTYTGNDKTGYATYDIIIDLDGLVFIDPLKLYIMKRSDRLGSWECLNTQVSGNTLVAIGLTDFSDFAIGGSEALPVELSSFVSSISGNSVTLNWTTSSEINNSGFDIERSSVNGEWSKVGSVSGNGTSATPNSYSFTERNVASGNYSYRLKQTDFNGNFEYFNLSNEVVIGIPAEFKLSQNYPNPFNPSTTISYEIPVDGAVSLKIFDMSGKEVMNLVDGVKNAGYYSINFNASNLSSGIYFYKLSANDFSSVKKMMLVK